MTFKDEDIYGYGEREYEKAAADPRPVSECRYCEKQGRLTVYYMKDGDLKCGVALCSCEWGHWHERRSGDVKAKFFASLPDGVAPKGLPYSEYMQLMLNRRYEYMKIINKKAEVVYEEDTLPIPEASG